MQTFLPYPDFDKSAACLDRQRLGKQRVEVLQILKALRFGGGWSNHAATRMWRGYALELYTYGIKVCWEWKSRGYVDTCEDKLEALIAEAYGLEGFRDATPPPWLGNANFHASHRSNLLRKDLIWYGKFGWSEPDNLPYVWPVKKGA